MDNNPNNQPINPIEPAPAPTPAPDPEPTAAPITSPAPVQDVPTTYGDKPDKKSKAERKRNNFRAFSLILAIWCLYGFGTMSLDNSTCAALDHISNGLCGSFNTTLVIKNVVFGVVLAFCAANFYFAISRKKLALTLGAVFTILSAVAGIVLFIAIISLLNNINSATGLGYSSASFVRLQIEYGAFAIFTIAYAIAEGLYLFRSKYAKETFVN